MTEESVSFPVHLYVYDLSGGLARQLSASLLGRQIDAVYHTSIVIRYSTPKEYFFGQGISVTSPGGSHHGQPMEIIPLGSTSIDEETWNAILVDLKERFTPAAYNLMTNNCNNFSDEVANILVGRSIPAHITSLPADFQSAMSAMAANRGNGTMAGPSGPSPLLGLIDQMNQRGHGSSYAQQASAPHPAPRMLAHSGPSNLVNITSSEQLDQTLRNWPCAVVLFTNTKTCPPCKVLHPKFEEMAREYAPPSSSKAKVKHIAFAVVDSSPSTQSLMATHRIRGTPTLKFFVAGKERHQFSGADVAELRSQVDLTLFDVYVAHPHTEMEPPLSSVKTIPRQLIISSIVPNFTSAVRVIDEAVSAFKASDFKAKADVQDCRKVIVKRVVPWLEARFGADADKTKKTLSEDLAKGWKVASTTLMNRLPATAVFPLVDMLRLAASDQETRVSLSAVSLINSTLVASTALLTADGSTEGTVNRSLWLTTLRLLCNVVGDPIVMDALDDLQPLVNLLTTGVLHEDKAIRNAASSTMFNLCLLRVGVRSTFVERNPSTSSPLQPQQASSSSVLLGADFDTEAISSLVHSIQNEETSSETLHRLLASLFLLVYLSDHYEDLRDLLEVLDLQPALESKLQTDLVKEADKAEEIKTLLRDCIRLSRREA